MSSRFRCTISSTKDQCANVLPGYDFISDARTACAHSGHSCPQWTYQRAPIGCGLISLGPNNVDLVKAQKIVVAARQSLCPK
ncbi:hypothetical protein [Kibdelosporangium philippinense]|uniref:hypothetical protein n=1 Tax=Kibdelosporangium philippinense TaxID=211113 RepID=UPI003611E3CD